MDILKILLESKNELYPEELEFLETELATGGYKPEYVQQCREKISELKNWKKAEGDENKEVHEDVKTVQHSGVVVNLVDLAPKNNNSAAADMNDVDRFFEGINVLRAAPSYKSNFKKFIRKQSEVTPEFIETYYARFRPWELNAILSIRQLGEPFLEKYFGALDHDAIARYQEFSEQFFMKHFTQLDAEIVLQKGKNEWRHKDKRSTQLDVFLRLKGIKI